MSLKVFSFYDSNSGLIHPMNISCSREDIASLSAPAGHRVIEGSFDYQSQKIDISTGLVVDHQPPQPDEDHEWIHDDENGNRVRQWVKKPEVIEREGAIAQAKAEILRLESQQPRADREASIYGDKTRQREIEAAIQAQRQIIHEAETR